MARAQKGWLRTGATNGAAGGGPIPAGALGAAEFSFKAGDALYGAFECRTVDTLLAFGSNGRVYSVPVASLPGGRGDGQPLTTLIDLEPGTQLLHYFAGPAAAVLLLSGSGSYGFLATVEQMTSRLRAGKAFIALQGEETVCAPSMASLPIVAPGGTALPVATHVACASSLGRILTFEIEQLRSMANGGRGLMLIDLDGKDTLAGAAAYTRSIRIEGIGRGGKAREETLEIRSLNNARAARARKGKAADLGFKPASVTRVE